MSPGLDGSRTNPTSCAREKSSAPQGFSNYGLIYLLERPGLPGPTIWCGGLPMAPLIPVNLLGGMECGSIAPCARYRKRASISGCEFSLHPLGFRIDFAISWLRHPL